MAPVADEAVMETNSVASSEELGPNPAGALAPLNGSSLVQRRKPPMVSGLTTTPPQYRNGKVEDSSHPVANVANLASDLERRIVEEQDRKPRGSTDSTSSSIATAKSTDTPATTPTLTDPLRNKTRGYGTMPTVPDVALKSSDDADADDGYPVADQDVGLDAQVSSRVPLRNEKYFLVWPDWLDEILGQFDDGLIKASQWRTDGIVYAFSLFFTAYTAVESALPLPFMLFSLGYDVAGTVFATVLTVLGFLSQLPKRFLWRTRPWMDGRAKTVRKDRTSSFPSRGVICGVIFPITCLMAYEMESNKTVSRWIYFAVTSASVLGTSFARINVGAHYPSDTIAGLFMGLFVQQVGTWALRIWELVGSPIHAEGMYAEPAAYLVHGDLWRRTSWFGLAFATILSYLVTILCMRGFWQKCNYVFGLLFSCLTFRFVFLNPSLTGDGVSVAPMPRPSLAAHLQVWIIACALLGYGMKTSGKKGRWRMANFVLLYHGTLWLLLWYRL